MPLDRDDPTLELWDIQTPPALVHSTAALSGCLSAGDQRAFILGDATPDAVVGIWRHIQQCTNCFSSVAVVLARRDERKPPRTPLIELPSAHSSTAFEVDTIVGHYRVKELMSAGNIYTYRGENLLAGNPVTLRVGKPGLSEQLDALVEASLKEESLERLDTLDEVPLREGSSEWLNALDELLLREYWINPFSGRLLLQETARNIRATYMVFNIKPANRIIQVSEYIDGHSLQQVLKQRRLTIDEVITLGVAISSGLAQLHRHRFVHRALAPSGIIVRKYGAGYRFDRAALTNLELSACYDIVGSSFFPPRIEVILGIPLHMAPEHFEGQPPAKTMDIYALGLILYECVTGSPPQLVTPDSIHERPRRASRRQMEVIRVPRAAGLPKTLEAFINQCLSLRPTDRPQSGDDANSELRKIYDSVVTIRRQRI
jgi:serine/threonine protein kinase